MPAEMPPDRVTMHTLPLLRDYSITESFGACILLNVEKTVQLKYKNFTVEANRLREVAASRNVTAKGGRIRSRNFVSISSVA